MKKSKIYLAALLALVGLVSCTNEETSLQEKEATFQERGKLKIVLPALPPTTYAAAVEGEYGSQDDIVTLYFFAEDKSLAKTISFERGEGTPTSGGNWAYMVDTEEMDGLRNLRVVAVIFPKGEDAPDLSGVTPANGQLDALLAAMRRTEKQFLDRKFVFTNSGQNLVIPDPTLPGTINLQMVRRATRVELNTSSLPIGFTVKDITIINGRLGVSLFGNSDLIRAEDSQMITADKLYENKFTYINPAPFGSGNNAKFLITLSTPDGIDFVTQARPSTTINATANSSIAITFSSLDNETIATLNLKDWSEGEGLLPEITSPTVIKTINGEDVTNSGTYVTTEKIVTVTYSGATPQPQGLIVLSNSWGSITLSAPSQGEYQLPGVTIKFEAPAAPRGYTQLLGNLDLAGTRFWIKEGTITMQDMGLSATSTVEDAMNSNEIPLGYRLPDRDDCIEFMNREGVTWVNRVEIYNPQIDGLYWNFLGVNWDGSLVQGHENRYSSGATTNWTYEAPDGKKLRVWIYTMATASPGLSMRLLLIKE